MQPSFHTCVILAIVIFTALVGCGDSLGSKAPSPMPSEALPTLSPAPTADPTVRPTLSPTAPKTAKPTNSPVPDPTQKPTKRPTLHPTAKPTVAPTHSFQPTVSYRPTPKPTFFPTLKATTPFLAANQTLNNIANMNATQWTADSFDVIVETISQVLYNYELCIEKIDLSHHVVPTSPLASASTQLKTSVSSAILSYSVYFDASVFSKPASEVYSDMASTLATAVQQGSFDSILHLMASYHANEPLASATSNSVNTDLVTPSAVSSSSNDSEKRTAPTLDESIGVAFACVAVVFFSCWTISSRVSRGARAKEAAVAK